MTRALMVSGISILVVAAQSGGGGSGWVSWARRSSWGWQIWRGMVVGRGAPWGHVQSTAGPCFGAEPSRAVSVRIETVFTPGQQGFLPEGFPFENDVFEDGAPTEQRKKIAA